MSSQSLAQMKMVAAKRPVESIKAPLAELVQLSSSYLDSAQAFASIECDPYWPKWNTPWWHMMLLYEMGVAEAISSGAVERMVMAVSRHYLKFFPFTLEELPEGADPLGQVACHCQLGTMHQLFMACGVDIELRLPWLKPWYRRYQLEDGGLNCDEAAYTRARPKSSVISTLPPLEAVLIGAQTGLSAKEIQFLDRGANYLIEKRLCRASSSGRWIDESWLKLCFPRFYQYDILRGLTFLLEWSLRLKRALPLRSIAEGIELLDKAFPDGRVYLQRSAWAGCRTRWFEQASASWLTGPASGYPLLEAVSEIGIESVYLTKIWNETKAKLGLAIEFGLLDES